MVMSLLRIAGTCRADFEMNRAIAAYQMLKERGTVRMGDLPREGTLNSYTGRNAFAEAKALAAADGYIIVHSNGKTWKDNSYTLQKVEPEVIGELTTTICKKCGQVFYARSRDLRKGLGKYCSRSCSGSTRASNPYKSPIGTRVFGKRGYVFIRTKSGFKAEHRLVIEKKLGRKILKGEHVHHVNEKKDDNRPENLVVLSSLEHSLLHGRTRSMVSQAKNCSLAANETVLARSQGPAQMALL